MSAAKVRQSDPTTVVIGAIWVALKLVGAIDWPWVWVLAPLWGTVVLAFVVFGIDDMIEAGRARRRRQTVGAWCFDCARPYGDEHGFPDLVLASETWRKISPTGDDGGLLCPSCIVQRCVAAGLTNVGVAWASGPLVGVPYVPLRGRDLGRGAVFTECVR